MYSVLGSYSVTNNEVRCTRLGVHVLRWRQPRQECSKLLSFSCPDPSASSSPHEPSREEKISPNSSPKTPTLLRFNTSLYCLPTRVVCPSSSHGSPEQNGRLCSDKPSTRALVPLSQTIAPTTQPLGHFGFQLHRLPVSPQAVCSLFCALVLSDPLPKPSRQSDVLARVGSLPLTFLLVGYLRESRNRCASHSALLRISPTGKTLRHCYHSPYIILPTLKFHRHHGLYNRVSSPVIAVARTLYLQPCRNLSCGQPCYPTAVLL